MKGPSDRISDISDDDERLINMIASKFRMHPIHHFRIKAAETPMLEEDTVKFSDETADDSSLKQNTAQLFLPLAYQKKEVAESMRLSDHRNSCSSTSTIFIDKRMIFSKHCNNLESMFLDTV